MAKLDMSRMRSRTQKARASLADRDEKLKQARASAATTTMRLERVAGRAHSDTRGLKLAHLMDLMESIAALGLIEPIVVDAEQRLLAGGHRLAACRLLAAAPDDRPALAADLADAPISASASERLARVVASDAIDLQRIPVRVIAIDSVAEPDMALAIEASENTLRRDYTTGEVRALYDRLRGVGYVDRPGRPRKGERAIKPAIATIIGRSIRTVERMLADPPPDAQVLARSLRALSSQMQKVRDAVGDDAPEAVQDLVKRLDSPALRTALRNAIRSARDADGQPPTN